MYTVRVMLFALPIICYLYYLGVSRLHKALHQGLYEALRTEVLREALRRLCAKLYRGSI